MLLNKRISTTLVSIVSLTLMACGGGSGTPQDSATAISSKGIITGFGSVYINGIRFQTNNSHVVSEDDGSLLLENPSNTELQSILGKGHVIKVIGSSVDDSNGVARTILFDNELKGEISSVSNTDASFVVLGQTVSVTPKTIIDDSIIEAARGTEIPNDLRFADVSESLEQLLQAGMFVEISGLPSQNGFEATRIEDTDNQTSSTGSEREAEVKGIVSNLTADQFEINGLTVLFDTGDLDSEDFSNQALANGQFVEVNGSAVSSNLIEATRIELEEQFSDDNFLNNQNNVRIKDIAVSSDGVSFTTRLGVSVNPTNRSRLEDDTIDNDDHLSIDQFLGNISGKSVEARGFSQDSNTVWTRIEIEEDNDLECRLRGPVTNISGNAADFSLIVEGVEINTAQIQNNNFEDTADQSIGRTAFFNNLNIGDIVQATSDDSGNGCSDGNLTAREIESDDGLGSNSNSDSSDNGFNDNELVGTVTSVSDNGFVVAGKTISVTSNTLIDDSIIEDARGQELENDLPFGSLPESLQTLLPIGLSVEIKLSNSNGLVALSIEDN